MLSGLPHPFWGNAVAPGGGGRRCVQPGASANAGLSPRGVAGLGGPHPGAHRPAGGTAGTGAHRLTNYSGFLNADSKKKLLSGLSFLMYAISNFKFLVELFVRKLRIV